MAFFLFSAHSSSFSSRLNILALIVLVLVCFCSYCSSSLVSPLIDVDSSIDDADLFDMEDEITYYTPLKLSSHHYRSIPEQAILPKKNRFSNILLKTALLYPEYRRKLHNNKRYASQAFHAMRG